MRDWLEERHMNASRIVDLGLDGPEDDVQPTRLVEMMPAELACWLMARFETLGIPVKSLPTDAGIRRDIRERFERLLLGYVWEGMSQQLKVTHLLGDLDRQLHLAKRMIDQALDEQLKHCLAQESCAESYTAMLEQVLGKFFEGFMREDGARVRELAQEHMARVREGWKR